MTLKVVGVEYSEELQMRRYIVCAPYNFYKENLKNYQQVQGSYNNRTKEIAVWMTGEQVVFNKYIDGEEAYRIMETEATIAASLRNSA